MFHGLPILQARKLGRMQPSLSCKKMVCICLGFVLLYAVQPPIDDSDKNQRTSNLVRKGRASFALRRAMTLQLPNADLNMRITLSLKKYVQSECGYNKREGGKETRAMRRKALPGFEDISYSVCVTNINESRIFHTTLTLGNGQGRPRGQNENRIMMFNIFNMLLSQRLVQTGLWKIPFGLQQLQVEIDTYKRFVSHTNGLGGTGAPV